MPRMVMASREAPVAPRVSFSAGPHVCLGAGLARREVETALAALVRRMPNLRRGVKPPRRRCENIVFRGFYTLPVEF